MRHVITTALAGVFLLAASQVRAEDITVKMFKATQNGPGEAIGTITISESDDGAAFKLALHDLPPGGHGFHANDNANCGPTIFSGIRIPAGAAGAIFDPELTFKHRGPKGDGYLGDLPVMEVNDKGIADQTLVAPRIKDIEMLRGHSLVINVGGDNYSDTPLLNGGGGGRIACGVIE